MSTKDMSQPSFVFGLIEEWYATLPQCERQVSLSNRSILSDRIANAVDPFPPLSTLEWSEKPPTEQGWYWHWNGDPDCAPLPTSVLHSGTSQKCFVSMGQLGIEQAVDCDVYGGYWMRMMPPDTHELEPLIQVMDDDSDDGEFFCERCQNRGFIDCHCGGDLCVCENAGEAPCPECDQQ